MMLLESEMNTKIDTQKCPFEAFFKLNKEI